MNSAIDKYVSAVNTLNREAYIAAFTDDAVVADPYGGRPFEGTAGLAKFFTGMERTWDAFEMVLGQPYAGGDRVAVGWSVRATAKSGKQAEFTGINVFTITEDGQISRLEGYWDMEQMLAQIR